MKLSNACPTNVDIKLLVANSIPLVFLNNLPIAELSNELITPDTSPMKGVTGAQLQKEPGCQEHWFVTLYQDSDIDQTPQEI